MKYDYLTDPIILAGIASGLALLCVGLKPKLSWSSTDLYLQEMGHLERLRNEALIQRQRERVRARQERVIQLKKRGMYPLVVDKDYPYELPPE